jgi:protein TonB
VVSGNILEKTQPVYPPIAKQAHVQGTVVLHAVIGKDGRIKNLNVISGNAMLTQAAVDAVQNWRYKPYLLNGEPTEVDTTVTVNFSFGGG